MTRDRDTLFRETFLERNARRLFGIAHAAMPARIGAFPMLARFWLAQQFAGAKELPDPAQAPMRFGGVCGTTHDLSVPALLDAHARGLHPASHVGPVKWWSPPERCVLAFEDFHMSRRLRSRLRQARHRVTFDADFDRIMKACAARRPGKWPITWITPKIMHAYAALHDAGHAHSFEVWDANDELVGGGYGVVLGGLFIIESQFAFEPNASKIGFSVLNWHLAHWGYVLNDNKGPTPHVLEMGFRVVPRAQYLAELLPAALQVQPHNTRWTVEADLKTVAEWLPQDGQIPSPSLAPLVQEQGCHFVEPKSCASVRSGAVVGITL